jgi:hypothetical protein
MLKVANLPVDFSTGIKNKAWENKPSSGLLIKYHLKSKIMKLSYKTVEQLKRVNNIYHKQSQKTVIYFFVHQ